MVHDNWAALLPRLTAQWAGRKRFVLLDSRFDTGQRFLAIWQAWRRTAAAGGQLHFITRANRAGGAANDNVPGDLLHEAEPGLEDGPTPCPELLAELRAAWPPGTPDLHQVSLDGGRVQLWLAMGSRKAWLNELVARVDAFVIQPEPDDSDNTHLPPHWLKALTRLATPQALLCALNSPAGWAGALRTAGFDPAQEPPGRGHDGQRARTRWAHFAPRFRYAGGSGAATEVPPASASASATTPGAAQVLILGAGLAGCAAAWALAEQGCSSQLIDRHAQPAHEASGNPAGLFHGIVNAHDGVHARFNRSAALHARQAITWAIDHLGAPGQADGLLRMETRLSDAAAMQRQIDDLGLPRSYVQALDITQASERSGMAMSHPAWFFPGGGWVDPAALSQAFLTRAGPLSTFVGGTEVQRVSRQNGLWQLWDRQDRLIAQAPQLVLANAHDATRLRGHTGWPVQKVRGQISLWRHATQLPSLRLPVTGAGYLLPRLGELSLFGATAQAGDDDAAVRADDHARNLVQLARLTGLATPPDAVAQLQGRVAWRMVCADRLPLVGAMPDFATLAHAEPAALRNLRRLAREPGLHVLAGLGSRGITWAALAARVVAAQITGAPHPLEAGLLDAIDPGRFLVRQHRRREASGAG